MNSHESTSSVQRNLLTSDIQKKLNADHLAAAELSRLIVRLNEIPEFKHNPSTKPNEHVGRLLARRAELLQQRRQIIGAWKLFTDFWIDPILLHIDELLWPWTTLDLPYFSEGINQTPGVPGTSGAIDTAGLYAGGLGYGGDLWDDGITAPGTEKWWIHNWNCSAVFPAAPFSGRLYYRFVVDSECHIYHVSVTSGSVKEFVTIGWTADSATQALDNWNTVGWPVDVTLPYPGSLNFGTPVPVSGSIDVTQGKNAALGFTYGTIVSGASGDVQFSWANFGTRRAGTSYGPSDYDKIEYRFVPDWWIIALTRRLALAPRKAP
jgi:hypothetical protein